MNAESIKTESYTFRQKFCYLMCRADYTSVLFTLTLLFLVISGIQYWITDYVVSVLEHTKETAFIVYIIVGALGPVFGVALSGCIFDRMGGYHGINTPLVFTGFMCLAGSLGLLSTAIANVYWLASCVLIQLLFGGFCVPVLTGFMITRVPPKMRTQANSIANLSYNLFGFFPAPSVYGIVYQATGSGTSRWGLFSIQVFGAFTILLMAPYMAVKRYKDNRELEKYEQSV